MGVILEYRLADLSRQEVERVRSLERDLGVILVAYSKKAHPLEGDVPTVPPARLRPAAAG